MELDYNELLLIRKALTEKIDNTDTDIEYWENLDNNGKEEFDILKNEYITDLNVLENNLYMVMAKIDLEINRKGE